MFPLDSNLDTFSLCREACRGAIVPWCRGEWFCGASHLLGVPRPKWRALSLLHQSRFHVNYYRHALRCLVVWGLYLEHRISSAILHSYSINCPLRVTQLPLSRLWISQACLVWFWWYWNTPCDALSNVTMTCPPPLFCWTLCHNRTTPQKFRRILWAWTELEKSIKSNCPCLMLSIGTTIQRLNKKEAAFTW